MNEFFAIVTRELVRVRKLAGLSQVQVAERLHTKQSAIARMENDKRGSTAMRRIADYAIACGYIPCVFDCRNPAIEFHCIPLEEARDFLLEEGPQKPLTWSNYINWKCRHAIEEIPPHGNGSNQLTYSANNSHVRLAS